MQLGFSGGSVVKNLDANVGDSDSTPVLGIFPGEGNGNRLQYSCLENPMGRGLQSMGSRRVKYQLSTHTCTMQLLFLIYISNHILVSSINKLILPLHKPSKSLGLNMKIKLHYLCRGAKFSTPTFLWHVHYFELKTIKVQKIWKKLWPSP